MGTRVFENIIDNAIDIIDVVYYGAVVQLMILGFCVFERSLPDSWHKEVHVSIFGKKFYFAFALYLSCEIHARVLLVRLCILTAWARNTE